MKNNEFRDKAFEDNLEAMLASAMRKADSGFEERLVESVLTEVERGRLRAEPYRKTHRIWRMIMKSRITKLSAVAAIIVAAVALMTNVGELTAPVYAITQTIEANRGLRFVHVRNVSPPAYEQQDTWLEFDENGELVRMRVEEGKEESFRIMVWANDTIRWYSPPKNEFVILHETHGIKNEVRRAKELVDPGYAVQSVYDLHLEGKVDVDVELPASEGELIKLTATDTEPLPLQNVPEEVYRVRVLLIEPQTKLAIQRDEYLLKAGRYELKRRQLYLGYDEPIDPEMFVLEQPEGVELEDRTKGIGMPQGDMTDAEAAAEVVRQYIEALIARDYEKAGKLYNGRRIEEKLKIKYVRVIGVGEPVPKPERGPRAFGVPFAFLIETSDGRLEIAGPWGGLEWSAEAETNLDFGNLRQAMVRPVVDQPERWVITGGI
jgi:hypothetical protein